MTSSATITEAEGASILAEIEPNRPTSLRDTLPPLLSKRQAAEIAGVNESTIRRMCERGKLTCCRFGNRWRINRDALLAYAGLE